MSFFLKDEYDNFIWTGLGSFLDLKSDKLPLFLDIMNNISLVVCNIDRGFRQEISLLWITLFGNREVIDRAIDLTLSSFKLSPKGLDPKDKNPSVVYGKKSYAKSILLNKKESYLAIIQDNKKISKYDSINKLSMIYELENYKNTVIRRFLIMKSKKFNIDLMNLINDYITK